MSKVATIGDTSPDGLVQITDTRWDSNGTMFVTVREMIGSGCWDPSVSNLDSHGFPLNKARRLARRALAHPEKTRSARVVRRFKDGGCDWVTFAVSRLDPSA